MPFNPNASKLEGGTERNKDKWEFPKIGDPNIVP